MGNAAGHHGCFGTKRRCVHEPKVILGLLWHRVAPTDATEAVVAEPKRISVNPHIFPPQGSHPLRSILACQIMGVVIAATESKWSANSSKSGQRSIDLIVDLA